MRLRQVEILSNFEKTVKTNISRAYCFYGMNNLFKSIEWHCFTDTSNGVYCSVAYLRFIKKSGEVKLTLVSSKSQMVSIKNEIMILKSDLSDILQMNQHSVSIKEAFWRVYNIRYVLLNRFVICVTLVLQCLKNLQILHAAKLNEN